MCFGGSKQPAHTISEGTWLPVLPLGEEGGIQLKQMDRATDYCQKRESEWRIYEYSSNFYWCQKGFLKFLRKPLETPGIFNGHYARSLTQRVASRRGHLAHKSAANLDA